jgi:hypothetical protein
VIILVEPSDEHFKTILRVQAALMEFFPPGRSKDFFFLDDLFRVRRMWPFHLICNLIGIEVVEVHRIQVCATLEHIGACLGIDWRRKYYCGDRIPVVAPRS